MESLQDNPVLEFPPDLLNTVRKMYNLHQPGRMVEAVDILEEWIKKQEHFMKKDFSRSYLENTIIGSKGSLERAKSRIDKLCTFRTLLPKLFEITNITAELGIVLENMNLIILPKLTKDNYRVAILRVNKTNFQSTDFVKFTNSIFIALEYAKQFDYAVGYLVISDYSRVPVNEIISKINLIDMQQLITVASDGYGVRIQKILFLTPSKLIDGFIKLVKQLLPEKIGKRFQVIKSIEEMHEFVPKEILPLEYGGAGRSGQEIHDLWMDVLCSEEHVNFVRDMKNARIDEAYRQSENLNDQYMGISGTFRTLSFD